MDEIDKQASFIVYSDASIRIKQIKQSEYGNFLQKSFMSIPNQDSDFMEPKNDLAYAKSFNSQSSGYGFYAFRVRKSAKSRFEIQIN
jgi:hypothetical protein